MIKRVAYLNNKIIHVFHGEDEEIEVKGIKIKEIEMEYDDNHGWVEVGFSPELSIIEKINILEEKIKEKDELIESLLNK